MSGSAAAPLPPPPAPLPPAPGALPPRDGPSGGRARRRARSALAIGIGALAIGAVLWLVDSITRTDEATNEPPTRAAVLHEEDFSSPTWPIDANARRTISTEDGAYLIRVDAPSLVTAAGIDLDEAWNGVTVAVDAEEPTGSAGSTVGVGCESEDGRSYQFMVEPRTGRFAVWFWRGRNSIRPLAGGTADPGTISGPGATNRLRAECVHDATDQVTSLRFAVNGEDLVGFDHRGGIDAFLGMSVVVASSGAPGAEGTFDDALMTRRDGPSPSAHMQEALERAPRMRVAEMLLFDDMRSSRTGLFGTERGPTYSMGYTGGAYRITTVGSYSWRYWVRWLRGERHRSVVVGGFVRKATVEGGRALAGPTCFAERDERGYGFVVDADAGEWLIVEVRGSDWITLATGTSPAVSFGADPSFVEGTCSWSGGATILQMSVNGMQVGTYEDLGGPRTFHGVGVISSSVDGATDMRFDDVGLARVRSTR